MKRIFGCLLLFLIGINSFGQENVYPLLYNSYKAKQAVEKVRAAGTGIDSTFIYNIDTLDLPVWDDFSIDKFQKYDAGYADANVTNTWFWYLMNATNTAPLSSTASFCDSNYTRHDTIVVTGAITDVYSYWDDFSGNTVNVNDLNNYPVVSEVRTLFAECYVLIDSVIDGVPNPTQDTIYYTPQYVQDSANVFFVNVDEPNQIWIDMYACHNYTFPVDPWSLGVASLDGTDENGMPYDFGDASAHEIADYLTSKPINLGGKSDVYLTFLYQAGGHGNDPDVGDSLIVDFWHVDSAKWYIGWYVNGGITPDQWDTAHIPVSIALLKDGFRFRFRNWASTSAALDHWHIDYVELIDNDLPTVDYFNDLAISYPINTFLNDYTAVPWDHYRNNGSPDTLMVQDGTLYVYNSAANPSNYADGTLEVRHDDILQGGSPWNLPNPAVTPTWTANWELSQNTYPYDIGAVYTFDQAVDPDPQTTFDVKINIATASAGQNIHAENDTNWFTQKFDNYYSYDDGSAEAAYGLTGSHALLAYQFNAYEVDTLTGVLMHFVPWVDDLSSELFLLTVWEDSAGQPGKILYQDDYFSSHSPIYDGSKNGFRYYDFTNDVYTVDVPGEPNGRKGIPLTGRKFYVGWEQIEDFSLMIGLDWNIDSGDKIYRNVSGTWLTSSFDCSLLIRPVFSTGLNYTLNNKAEEENLTINMYPNPAENRVFLNNTPENFQLMVFDLSGRILFNDFNQKEVDLSDYVSGVYIVNVLDEDGVNIFSGKLIKR